MAPFAIRALPATLQRKPALLFNKSGESTIVGVSPDGAKVFSFKAQGGSVIAFEVADLDGDKESEILVGQSSQLGLVCLDSKGTQRWTFNGIASPSVIAVADGNGDGKPEVFVAYRGSDLVDVVDKQGQEIGQWTTSLGLLALTGADLDGDHRAEFCASGLNAPVPPGGKVTAGGYAASLQLALAGLAADGKELWKIPLGSGFSGMLDWPIGVGDLDGDGHSEWVRVSLDGSVTVYDLKGKVIGQQSMGKYITGMTITPAAKQGQKARLWLGLDTEVVGLDWTKWMARPSTTGHGAK